MTILYIILGAAMGVVLMLGVTWFRSVSVKELVIKAYYYSELVSIEARKKALAYGIEVISDDDWWIDDVIDSWRRNLIRIGYFLPEIAFSNTYSQGDGASFIAKDINLVDWINEQLTAYGRKDFVFDPLFLQAKEMLALGKLDDITLSLTRSGNYVHENSVTAQLTWKYNDSVSSADRSTIDKVFQYVESKISLDVVKQSKLIFGEIQAAYSENVNNEKAAAYLEGNSVWFDDCGNYLKH